MIYQIVNIEGFFARLERTNLLNQYGWSGESVKVLAELLNKAGFSVANDDLKVMWNPDEKSIAECMEFGRRFAEETKLKQLCNIKCNPVW